MELDKTKRVLERDHSETEAEEAGTVMFVQWPEEATPEQLLEYPDTAILFSEETWTELGSPEKITVTIEPGDLFNVHDPIGSKCSLLDCPEVHDPDPEA